MGLSLLLLANGKIQNLGARRVKFYSTVLYGPCWGWFVLPASLIRHHFLFCPPNACRPRSYPFPGCLVTKTASGMYFILTPSVFISLHVLNDFMDIYEFESKQLLRAKPLCDHIELYTHSLITFTQEYALLVSASWSLTGQFSGVLIPRLVSKG